MLRVWVHGCDQGRVSDGSRLALCQTLSIECPSSIFFWHVYFAILVSFTLSFLIVCVFLLLSLELGRCSSDLFLSSRPRVPDWQPRIVLGMVEARSVNVKKTTTTTSTQAKSGAYLRDSSRVPRRRPLIYVKTAILHRVSLVFIGSRNCVPMAFTAESPPAQGQQTSR